MSYFFVNQGRRNGIKTKLYCLRGYLGIKRQKNIYKKLFQYLYNQYNVKQQKCYVQCVAQVNIQMHDFVML